MSTELILVTTLAVGILLLLGCFCIGIIKSLKERRDADYEIKKLSLRDGDIIVLHARVRLSDAAKVEAANTFIDRAPKGVRVVVLPPTIDLKVMSKE
jgi:hypothetical protein